MGARSPRRARSRARRAASARGGVGRRGPRPCGGGSGATLRPEAKRAAPSVGQRVVGARDVVAERGAGVRADEQAAGAAHARRERLGRRRPTSCRCSGASASANASAASSRPRGIRDCRRARRAARRSSLTATTSDVLAVLGLGAQVERQRARVGARATRSRVRSLGPAKPSMPTTPAHLPLGLLHVEVAGADDHVDAPDRLGPVARARRSPARRPCGRPRRPRTAPRRRGSPGAAAPTTTTSSTPAARAVTAPITHRRRVRAPGRRARRPPRAAPGTSRSRTVWPCSSVDRPSSSPARPRATASHVGRSRPPAPRARRDRGPSQRRVQARRGRPARRTPPPKRCSYSRTRRVAAQRATSSTIAATTSATDGGRRATVARTSRGDRGGVRDRAAHAARGSAPAASSISRRLELVRDRVGDQARGRGHDLLAHDEPVLAQRRAGRGEVDDPLDQPGQRRELDRALDLDDLRLAAGALEVAAAIRGYLVAIAHHARAGAAPRRRGRRPSTVANTIRSGP